jgi:hypothetical protein
MQSAGAGSGADSTAVDTVTTATTTVTVKRDQLNDNMGFSGCLARGKLLWRVGKVSSFLVLVSLRERKEYDAAWTWRSVEGVRWRRVSCIS